MINVDSLYSYLFMDKIKFYRIQKALKNIMLTDTYISMVDTISLKNFINKCYPNVLNEEEISNSDLKDMKILGYRILLTK